MIPKTDNFVTQRVQEFGSLLVVFFLFQMLTAIQLNDEFLFDADEIRDVVSNSVLSSEIDSQLIVADS